MSAWAASAAALPVDMPVHPLPRALLLRIAEGFFTDSRPPGVKAVWGAVFAFVCERANGSNTASAFLVRKLPAGENRADYYFVTAGHAADDCRRSSRYLVENLNGPRFEPDGITLAPQPKRLGGVEAVVVDRDYDLAVIKVRAGAALAIGQPVKIDGNCNRALGREIFAVGFPGVAQRRSLRDKRETKRWSRGEYVGLGRAPFRGAPALHIASTVDTLPGSSGGPAVDAQGVLVGMAVKGAAAPENGFRYDVDPEKKDDWQTFLVPCQAVSAILRRAGLGEAADTKR